MSKILVKLYVPMIEEQYDVMIPANKRIYKATEQLMKAVYELSRGNYKPNKMPILYDRITAKPYNLKATVKEAGIIKGTEIIMI